MRQLLFLISFYFVSVQICFSVSPPEGLNLKRAKQISGNDQEESNIVEPPPNLKLRSRMMAALNSHTETVTAEKTNLFASPLILTKNKKIGKPIKDSQAVTTTEAIPVEVSTSSELSNIPVSKNVLTPEEVRKKFSSVGDEKVNLKVRPVLRTNFVDANGKVVHDVVSIPIRVSDGAIHSISDSSKNSPKTTATSSVVETEKDVNVSFRSSLPVWLI